MELAKGLIGRVTEGLTRVIGYGSFKRSAIDCPLYQRLVDILEVVSQPEDVEGWQAQYESLLHQLEHEGLRYMESVPSRLPNDRSTVQRELKAFNALLKDTKLGSPATLSKCYPGVVVTVAALYVTSQESSKSRSLDTIHNFANSIMALMAAEVYRVEDPELLLTSLQLLEPQTLERLQQDDIGGHMYVQLAMCQTTKSSLLFWEGLLTFYQTRTFIATLLGQEHNGFTLYMREYTQQHDVSGLTEPLLKGLAKRNWALSGGMSPKELAEVLFVIEECRSDVVLPVMEAMRASPRELGQELAELLLSKPMKNLQKYLKFGIYLPSSMSFFISVIAPTCLTQLSRDRDRLELIISHARMAYRTEGLPSIYYEMIALDGMTQEELIALNDRARLVADVVMEQYGKGVTWRTFGLVGLWLKARREGVVDSLDYMLPYMVMDYIARGVSSRASGEVDSIYRRLLPLLPSLPQEEVDLSKVLARLFQDIRHVRPSSSPLDVAMDALHLLGACQPLSLIRVEEDFAGQGPMSSFLKCCSERKSASAFARRILVEAATIFHDAEDAEPLARDTLLVHLWSLICRDAAATLPKRLVPDILEGLDSKTEQVKDQHLSCRAFYYAGFLILPLLEGIEPVIGSLHPPPVRSLIQHLTAASPSTPEAVLRLKDRFLCFINDFMASAHSRPLKQLCEFRDQAPVLEAWAMTWDVTLPSEEVVTMITEVEAELQRLRQWEGVLEWLADKGVQEVIPVRLQTLGVLDQGAMVMKDDVMGASMAVQGLLGGPVGHTASGLCPTLFDFLLFFARNVVFEAMMRRAARPNRGADRVSLTMEGLRDLTGKALDMFNSLFHSSSTNLQDLEDARDLLRNVDVYKEVVSVAQFFDRQHKPVTSERLRAIQNAFRLLQHLGNVPEVLALIDQYRLVEEEDKDLAFLQDRFGGVEDEEFVDLSDFDQNDPNFRRLDRLFQHLNPHTLELFRLVSSNGPLREFLMDPIFAPEKNAELAARVANITMELHGQQYKDQIFSSFLSCRTYMSPFTHSVPQSLMGFFEQVGGLRLEADTKALQCIGTAGRELGLIKELFNEASNTSLQNAVVLIRRLRDPRYHAAFVVQLGVLLNRPTHLELRWKQCSDGQGAHREESLNEEQIDELLRKLNFVRRDPLCCEEVTFFLELLSLLRAMASNLVRLEQSGHPCHQICTERVPLATATLESIRDRCARYHKEEEEWLRRLEHLPEPALLMSHVELCRLLYLVKKWGDPLERQRFLEAGACRRLYEGHDDLDDVAYTQIRSTLAWAAHVCRVPPTTITAETYQQFLGSHCSAPGAGHGGGPGYDGDALDQETGAAILQSITSFRRPPITPRECRDGRQYYAYFDGGGPQAVPAFILQHCVPRGGREGRAINLPARSDLLWCGPQTTTHDVQSFFHRLHAFPDRVFFMIGLDHLSPEVRKETYQHQAELARSSRSKADVVYCICKETKKVLQQHFLTELRPTQEPPLDLPRLQRLLHDCFQDRLRLITVLGRATEGKSHVIHKRCRANGLVTAQISFATTTCHLDVLHRLAPLTLSQEGNVVFSVSEYADFGHLSRILFELAVLGVVSEPTYGVTMAVPHQARWTIFVEVPEVLAGQTLQKNLDYCLPLCAMISSELLTVVGPEERLGPGDGRGYVTNQLEIGTEERWVAQVINAKEVVQSLDRKEIAPLTDDGASRQVLMRHIGRVSALKPWVGDSLAHTALYISYLHRRFEFFGPRGVFYHNTDFEAGEDYRGAYHDYRRLGSDLFEAMVEESLVLAGSKLDCDVDKLERPILVYDTNLALKVFHKEGAVIPTELRNYVEDGMKELQADYPDRIDQLKMLLAWTLGFVSPNALAAFHRILDARHFVVMEGFVYELLHIVERYRTGRSMIIESLTGCGKTYKLELLAALLNEALSRNKEDSLYFSLEEQVNIFMLELVVSLHREGGWTPPPHLHLNATRGMGDDDDVDGAQLYERLVEGLRHETLTRRQLLRVFQEACGAIDDGGALLVQVKDFVAMLLAGNSLLEASPEMEALLRDDDGVGLEVGDEEARELALHIMDLALQLKLRPLVHRMLVHPDLRPEEVTSMMASLIHQAEALPEVRFIAFFDETNTSRCLGIFKEMFVDRTLGGRRIPDNIFFVGAINPYIQVEGSGHGGTRGQQRYDVFPLPRALADLQIHMPSLDSNEVKLREYVRIKVSMFRQSIEERWSRPEDGQAGSGDGAALAAETLVALQYSEDYFTTTICLAHIYIQENFGPSSVSQREIQRVFRFMDFFLLMASRCPSPEGLNPMASFETAMHLAVSLVYYFRLPDVEDAESDVPSRLNLSRLLGVSRDQGKHVFANVVDDYVKFFVSEEHFVIPPGVARNKALRENIFCTVACVENRIPLGIIGEPGTSKTLSFHIVLDNLRGPDSPKAFCRQFCSLEPFFLLCNPNSTSSEITVTFLRAIERAASYEQSKTKRRVVVFVDEAGLADQAREIKTDGEAGDRKMVLKALHPFLDECKVSAICISNTALDAANTNRMVTLVRCKQIFEDLLVLARGCLGFREDTNMWEDCIAQGLCKGYLALKGLEKRYSMEFSDRDFIYTLRHLSRMSPRDKAEVDPMSLLHALEENFNGVTPQEFQDIARTFFTAVEEELVAHDECWSFQLPWAEASRHILDIIHSHMHPTVALGKEGNHQLKPRPLLIIDPSDNDAAIRLLRSVDVLQEASAKVVHVSPFPSDCTQVHSTRYVSEVKYLMEAGAKVILRNAEAILGSFFDLFNQSYREVVDHEGRARLFVHVALGPTTHPCPVHPDFACVLVVRKRDIDNKAIPSALLSRFSKYMLRVEEVFLRLDLWIKSQPEREFLLGVFDRVVRFVEEFQPRYVLGVSPDGIRSMVAAVMLSKLQEQPDGSWAFNPAMGLSQAASSLLEGSVAASGEMDAERRRTILAIRCIQAHLLQLVAPEHYMLRCTIFPDYACMTRLYFLEQHHMSLRSLLGALGQQVQSGTVRVVKRVVYMRSSPDVLRLDAEAALPGGGMAVIHVDTLSNEANLNEILRQVVQAPDQAGAVMVVDYWSPRMVGLVNYLRSVVDSMARGAEQAGTPKIFVIILHSPPHILYHQSALYPTLPLDGWECSYVDAVEGMRQEIIVELVEAICACARTSTLPTIDVGVLNGGNDLVDHEQIFHEFCTRLRVVGRLNGVTSDSGALLSALYTPEGRTMERCQALKSICERLPDLMSALTSRVTTSLPATDLRRTVFDLATEVAKGSPESFSEMLDGRFASQFMDCCLHLMGRLVLDGGVLALERAMREGFVSMEEALMLVQVVLDLAPPREEFTPPHRRGRKEVVVTLTGKAVPQLPFFTSVWKALRKAVDAVTHDFRVQGSKPSESKICEAVDDTLASSSPLVARGLLDAICPGSGLGQLFVSDVISNGGRQGVKPDPLEVEFWTAWYSLLPNATKGVPLAVAAAVAPNYDQARLHDLELLTKILRDLGQTALLRKVLQANRYGGRDQLVAALRAQLSEGLCEELRHLLEDHEAVGTAAWDERCKHWLSKYPFVQQLKGQVHAVTAEEEVQDDLMALVYLLLSAAPDPNTGLELRTGVARVLMRDRVVVRRLGADLFQRLEGLLPAEGETLHVVFRLFLSYLFKTQRDRIPAATLETLSALLNDRHDASPLLDLRLAFKVYMYEEMVRHTKGRAHHAQKSLAAAIGKELLKGCAESVPPITVQSLRPYRYVPQCFDPSIEPEGAAARMERVPFLHQPLAHVLYEWYVSHEIPRVGANIDDLVKRASEHEGGHEAAGVLMVKIRKAAFQVELIKVTARRLGAYTDLATADFMHDSSHVADGRLIKAICKSYLETSENFTIVFFGTMWAEHGQSGVERALMNPSLAGNEAPREYWIRQRSRFTYRVSAEDLMLRPSFMIPDVEGEEEGNPAIRSDVVAMRAPFIRFDQALKSSLAVGSFDGLTAHCRDEVSAHGEEGRARLKAFFVATIYHDFYRTNRLEMLRGLPQLVDEVLRDLLQLCTYEVKVVKALADPHNHMLMYGASHQVSRLFDVNSCQTSTELYIRHALVNALSLLMYSGGPRGEPTSFFGTAFYKPLALSGTHGLMSSYARVVDTSVHYDCGTTLLADGSLEFRQRTPNVSMETLYVAILLAYGGFAMSFLFHEDATDQLYDPVLAKHAIDTREVGCMVVGDSPTERTSNFCYARLIASFHFLVDKNADLNEASAVLLVTRMMEALAQQVRTRGGPMAHATLADMQQVEEAERSMDRDLADVRGRLAAVRGHLSSISGSSEFLQRLESFVLSCGKIQAPSVAGMDGYLRSLDPEQGAAFRILRGFQDRRSLLLRLPLVRPLYRLYTVINHRLMGRVTKEESRDLALKAALEREVVSLKSAEKEEVKRIYEDGKRAYNELQYLMNGAFQPEICPIQAEIPPFTDETRLDVFISHDELDQGDMLFRLIRQVLSQQCKFLFLLKVESDESTALEKAVVAQLPLEKLPLSLALSSMEKSLILDCHDLEPFDAFLAAQHEQAGGAAYHLAACQAYLLINHLLGMHEIDIEAGRALFGFSPPPVVHDDQALPRELSAPMEASLRGRMEQYLGAEPQSNVLTLVRHLSSAGYTLTGDWSGGEGAPGIAQVAKQDLSVCLEMMGTPSPVLSSLRDAQEGLHPGLSLRLSHLNALLSLCRESLEKRDICLGQFPHILRQPLEEEVIESLQQSLRLALGNMAPSEQECLLMEVLATLMDHQGYFERFVNEQLGTLASWLAWDTVVVNVACEYPQVKCCHLWRLCLVILELLVEARSRVVDDTATEALSHPRIWVELEQGEHHGMPPPAPRPFIIEEGDDDDDDGHEETKRSGGPQPARPPPVEAVDLAVLAQARACSVIQRWFKARAQRREQDASRAVERLRRQMAMGTIGRWLRGLMADKGGIHIRIAVKEAWGEGGGPHEKVEPIEFARNRRFTIIEPGKGGSEKVLAPSTITNPVKLAEKFPETAEMYGGKVRAFDELGRPWGHVIGTEEDQKPLYPKVIYLLRDEIMPTPFSVHTGGGCGHAEGSVDRRSFEGGGGGGAEHTAQVFHPETAVGQLRRAFMQSRHPLDQHQAPQMLVVDQDRVVEDDGVPLQNLTRMHQLVDGHSARVLYVECGGGGIVPPTSFTLAIPSGSDLPLEDFIRMLLRRLPQHLSEEEKAVLLHVSDPSLQQKDLMRIYSLLPEKGSGLTVAPISKTVLLKLRATQGGSRALEMHVLPTTPIQTAISLYRRAVLAGPDHDDAMGDEAEAKVSMGLFTLSVPHYSSMTVQDLLSLAPFNRAPHGQSVGDPEASPSLAPLGVLEVSLRLIYTASITLPDGQQVSVTFEEDETDPSAITRAAGLEGNMMEALVVCNHGAVQAGPRVRVVGSCLAVVEAATILYIGVALAPSTPTRRRLEEDSGGSGGEDDGMTHLSRWHPLTRAGALSAVCGSMLSYQGVEVPSTSSLLMLCDHQQQRSLTLRQLTSQGSLLLPLLAQHGDDATTRLELRVVAQEARLGDVVQVLCSVWGLHGGSVRLAMGETVFDAAGWEEATVEEGLLGQELGLLRLLPAAQASLTLTLATAGEGQASLTLTPDALVEEIWPAMLARSGAALPDSPSHVIFSGPTGTTAEAAEVMDCTLEEVWELVDAPGGAQVTVMPFHHQAAKEEA